MFSRLLAVTIPGRPSVIDDAAQNLEQPGSAMDFIDDHELAVLRAQVAVGVVEASAVGGALKIEIPRTGGPMRRQLSGECRFSNLPRPEQHDPGHHGKPGPQNKFKPPAYHCCKSNDRR